MINSISSGMQMPQMQSSQAALSTEQKDQVQQILSQYSADDLSSDDATSIVKSFAELNVVPGRELEQLMADNGFDAKSIGDMAGQAGAKMPPPPPPPSAAASNSSELVSFLEELLENYDSQLSDDDKDAILSAVQQKFGTDSNGSLLSVKA
ncbi:hypothetical protein [Rheinheimera baltica]|uniref:Orphan protein n=1 Tax=Rheinheimera baltica TaxID=67576 RepID=A0ABT9I4A1_9GAMM|nr:hypothetical protein [Rheinheimera baltica]MDP5138209.1 hypothetical protein [Rheinheimera baltica]MDP5141137.1 hypothetical protein [Rheinheimera baltica]MDP5148366.1 hypothetical protein [Rheinheimera baltica]MDP5191334.1 hypothetical protein [Rheinheimera baltica]